MANTASGVSVTARVAAALHDIEGQVAQMVGLVNSVSAASEEQSQSMQTIHCAVGKHAVSQLLLLVGRRAS